MHPNHNPQFKEAQLPISSHRLDGRATDAITRQQNRLEEQIGDVNESVIPGQEDERLYGYNFEVNGDAVELTIDPNNAEDMEFVDARNRAAVLRSRERSRGSRRFNFAFLRSRGHGPGGHGYDIPTVETEYGQRLSNFIARKVSANPDINHDEDSVTQAVSRSLIQEQKQMSALENMAAEQKSGNRFMNFLRRHKTSRAVLGLALTGVGVVGLATGQLEVAIPAFAARSALSATGGYILGRTGWDAFQGWRSKKKPHDDIRMAGTNNGDFSGRLTPRAAFERIVKLLGAEARAGSLDQKRQAAIQRMGGVLVHQYYTSELDFSGGHTAADIVNQVQSLQQGTIRPLEYDRLRSDQTQSRKRHLAGLAGGLVMGALPLTRTIGLVDIGLGEHAGKAHAAARGALSKDSSGHGAGGSRPDIAPKGTGGTATGSVTSGSPHASTEINIYGGPGNDNITVGSLREAAHHGIHGGYQDHGLGVHHLHETFDGISTGELHVEPGGGFISTLQEQYHLNPAQAEAAYHSMYDQLHGAPGTYMDGSDIRISDPGNFKLPEAARVHLEEHLEAFHRIPEHIHANAYHVGGLRPGEIDPRTGGILAPGDAALHGHGLTAPDIANGSPAYDLNIYGGPGNDNINVILPGAGGPHEQALQAMLNGNYVAETGLSGLTPEQAAQIHYHIADLIHNGGASRLTPGAKTAIEQYTQASMEHPASGTAAHEAVERIRHLWLASGQSVNNLTPDQAESLQNDLVIVNAR